MLTYAEDDSDVRFYIYVSSYYYYYVLILLYMCPHTTMCTYTTIHVSSYYDMCVLIPLYVSSCSLQTCTMPFSEVNEEVSQSEEPSQKAHLHTNRQVRLTYSSSCSRRVALRLRYCCFTAASAKQYFTAALLQL
jgi:hypothetical protein